MMYKPKLGDEVRFIDSAHENFHNSGLPIGSVGRVSGFSGLGSKALTIVDLGDSEVRCFNHHLKLAEVCPWREAIAMLVGKRPPLWMRGNPSTALNDEQTDQLQDWIGRNLSPNMQWSTAIGIIEAAQALVHAAVDNGNITLENGIMKHRHG